MCKLHTLKNLYEKMKQGKPERWGLSIKKYEDVFYEQLFMDAVEHSAEHSHGICYKFGQKQHTLEDSYAHMLKMKGDASSGFGCGKWDACMKVYEDAFPEQAFVAAIEQSVISGECQNYYVGKHLGHELMEKV